MGELGLSILYLVMGSSFCALMLWVIRQVGGA